MSLLRKTLSLEEKSEPTVAAEGAVVNTADAAFEEEEEQAMIIRE